MACRFFDCSMKDMFRPGVIAAVAILSFAMALFAGLAYGRKMAGWASRAVRTVLKRCETNSSSVWKIAAKTRQRSQVQVLPPAQAAALSSGFCEVSCSKRMRRLSAFNTRN